MSEDRKNIQVISNNQTGGQTAGTINNNFKESLSNKRHSWLEIGSWVAGIIAAIVAVITLGDITMSDKPIINVTSNYQSGGQTAAVINNNYTPPPRILDDVVKSKLLKMVPKGEKVSITAVMGDQEAFSFASQMADFYKSNDRVLVGLGTGFFNRPIIGQGYNKKGDVHQFMIGERKLKSQLQ